MPPDPLILGFDTSAAHCAAALLSGEDIVVARQEDMAKGQAERLLPLLEEVLAEAGIDWIDLQALGVGVGPGNFTGVRIGVSAARGLALALGIPAVGVTALEAAAFGVDGAVLAALTAPRGQLYVQVFGPDPGPFRLCDPEDLNHANGIACVGSGREPAATATGGWLADSPPIAEAVARIAALRWRETPDPPKPLYIRPPDAALPSDPPPLILDDA